MRRELWTHWKVAGLEFIGSTGQVWPVEVRRRRGTRHMRLSLNLRNEIVASVPWHCSDRACQRFIEQNSSWLEGQIKAAPALFTLKDWLAQSPQLSVGGALLSVQVKASSSALADYRIDRGAACVELYLPEGAGEVTRFKLLQRFARAVLPERVAELAGRVGVPYGRLHVRDQSSRWGSCSSRGSLSLNWRLVLIPPHLQDYIIYHELAHLTEMNHSGRFWALLDRYDPQRKQHEEELDALAPTIMRVRE